MFTREEIMKARDEDICQFCGGTGTPPLKYRVVENNQCKHCIGTGVPPVKGRTFRSARQHTQQL